MRTKTIVVSYRDLRVWQEAMLLVRAIYRVSAGLPGDERFGLMAQLRRGAVSVASNIAEGWGRDHLGDYLHHLSVAKGALMEIETQLLLCVRLGFLSEREVEACLSRTSNVSRMLEGLSRSLRSLPENRTPKTEHRLTA